MSSVSVEGVRRSFGTREVLRGIDLVVPDGSVTALLGPSGCGKTTLLRILAGLDHADAGSVRLDDEVVTGPGVFVPARARRVGYVPQEGALFPHLTVEKNVAFGLARGSSARVTELLELVGLAEHRKAMPASLSGGQQQRVALARALGPEPRVLLLDEPFAALDASLRASLRQEVAALLRAAGTTVVLVTHDQDEALSVADRVALVLDGTVAQVGLADDLYNRPASPAVAEFLGSATLLMGTVVAGVAETVLGRLQVEAADGPVVLAVRPGQVALTGGAAGTVEAVEYRGHESLVRVRVADVLLAARVPSAPARGSQVDVVVDGPVLAWPA